MVCQPIRDRRSGVEVEHLVDLQVAPRPATESKPFRDSTTRMSTIMPDRNRARATRSSVVEIAQGGHGEPKELVRATTGRGRVNRADRACPATPGGGVKS